MRSNLLGSFPTVVVDIVPRFHLCASLAEY